MGACDVGFFEHQTLPKLPFGISIVVKLSDAIVDEIESQPTFTYFHHYRSVNALIDHILLRMGLLLEQNNHQYITIGASQSIPDLGKFQGRFSHKKAAYLSGLGTVGKNGLFLHQEFGARVRLGTLFTDFNGCKSNNPMEENLCNQCNVCVKSCPAQALYGLDFDVCNPDKPMLDYMACSNYMKKHFQHIGRGAVCGICMRICPIGQRRNNT